jgi:(p)ppGpp synthase/HD superfamily hydrolase
MNEQLPIALELAIVYHEGQMYGDVSYLVHLIEVDRNVVHMYANVKLPSEQFSKEPGDEVDCLRAIAFLHDIIEDTDCTCDTLTELGICVDVVDAVKAITKHEGQSYKDYIEAVKANPLALKVKLCDTAANLSNSLKDMNIKRINKYTKQIQLLGGFKK